MIYRIGDRVAVYGCQSPKEGGSCRYLDGDRGTVTKELVKGKGLEVRLDVPFNEPFLDDAALMDGIHPKQCRRLRAVRQ